jgi:hypothetical protein
MTVKTTFPANLFDKLGRSGNVYYGLNKKGTVRLSSDKE